MMKNATPPKAFFGFTRHPFPPACPPEPLFRTERIDAAIEEIRSALLSRLHALLVAPAGMGKSCLVRQIAADLNPRDFTVATLAGIPLSTTEWVHRVAEAYGIETSGRRGGAVKLLRRGLESLRPYPVLVLDEAHRIPIEAIDLVRTVAEESGRPILSIVLVGDETLGRRLSQQVHAPLGQRMAARIELGPLSEEETAAFIEHSFQVAGMPNILAPHLLAPLYAATGGVPRQIGRLISAAMQLALVQRSKTLSEEIVRDVLDGRRSR